MKREVIIACDFSSKEELNNFLANFEGLNPFLKIGMELFYKEGPELIKELKKKGCKIFLDLKLHDIPNTVHKAMRNIALLDVDITNVHAGGGIKMMQEALAGLREVNQTTKLIAVTELTSISQEILTNELHINEPLNDVVKAYATNAKIAGLDGIVCSPLEAPIAKELGIISVTPGIRFATDSKQDQKRVTTPAMARELGSTYIVVGRSITANADPRAAYLECVKEFE